MSGPVGELAAAASALMRDAHGMRQKVERMLAGVEAMMPRRIVTGAAMQVVLDELAAAASMTDASARALDATNARLLLLGAVIEALARALDGEVEDAAGLAETAGQLRLLLLDCDGCRPS